VSEDEDGRPILTTCIEMHEFALLIDAALGRPFRDRLWEACDRWYSIGADVVTVEWCRR
jgi:hypothetical protein